MFAPMIGFGIGWGKNMMGVPFVIVRAFHPEKRYGVYGHRQHR